MIKLHKNNPDKFLICRIVLNSFDGFMNGQSLGDESYRLTVHPVGSWCVDLGRFNSLLGFLGFGLAWLSVLWGYHGLHRHS